jgi:hypothetical protein
LLERRVLAGGLAGLLATVPMTVAMLALQRALPRAEQYALPPEVITAELVRHVRGAGPASEATQRSLTLPMHVGFGAFNGAVYAASLARLPAPLPLTSTAFAILIWATSYQGWAPALSLHPPATAEPPGSNTMMIVAHVVWGVSVALVLGRLGQVGART